MQTQTRYTPKMVMTALAVFAGIAVLSMAVVFGLSFQNPDQNSTVRGAELLLLSGLLIAVLVIAKQRHTQIAKLQAMYDRQQRREADFQKRVLQAHSIVSVSGQNGLIKSVNQNFVDTFGYSEDEVVGKDHSTIHVVENNVSAFGGIRETVSDGRVWSGEHKAVTKSGEVLSMQCTVIPLMDDNGEYLKSVSLRTDVTALRTFEENHYLNGMLGKLQDEVYIYTADKLNITYMNEMALRRCEWTIEEAKTRSVSDIFTDFNVELFRKHVCNLLDGEKESATIETVHEKGPIEINTRLYVGASGVPVYVSVVRDITERKLMEKSKMQGVSVVSHELRTPVTSIKAALRLLQSGAVGELDAKAMSVVDIAERNSERLLKVVNDILDFKKFQAQKMSMTMDRVDLASLVNEAVSANQAFGTELGVTFVAICPEEFASATVQGDFDRLIQVMSNLMSNAAKFSPVGGTVEVRLGQNDDHWRLSVVDQGPGIPKADLGIIFDSFSQLTPTDGVVRKGTGLGLAITKEIVERHSGKIDVDSEVGRGSAFHIDIPKPKTENIPTSAGANVLAAE